MSVQFANFDFGFQLRFKGLYKRPVGLDITEMQAVFIIEGKSTLWNGHNDRGGGLIQPLNHHVCHIYHLLGGQTHQGDVRVVFDIGLVTVNLRNGFQFSQGDNVQSR